MSVVNQEIGWGNASKLLQYILKQLNRLTSLISQLSSSSVTCAGVPACEADPIFNAWLVATPPLFSGDNIDWGAVISTNTTYKGETLSVTVDTNSIGFGGLLAQGVDFHFDEADASAMANCNMLVLALEAGTGTKSVLLRGQVCKTTWSWISGPIYASESTGLLTQSLPVAEDAVIAPVAWALSATTIYFNPYNAWATIYPTTTTTTTVAPTTTTTTTAP